MRLVSIAVVFSSLFSLSSQENRKWDLDRDWDDIHDMFYEEMSLQEQVEFYCIYFDDPSYYKALHSKFGFSSVYRYFREQEDEEAIPYFLHHFATRDLPTFSSPEKTFLASDILGNIIRLIEYRVVAEKNLDIDIALKFASLAEMKVLEYITRNRRIDINVTVLEVFIQEIQNHAKGLHRIDWLPEEDDPDVLRRFWGESVYKRYIVERGLEFLDVGIESPYVFEGYTGRVIRAEDPGYLGNMYDWYSSGSRVSPP